MTTDHDLRVQLLLLVASGGRALEEAEFAHASEPTIRAHLLDMEQRGWVAGQFDRKRGTWAITDAGRSWLASNRDTVGGDIERGD